MNEEILSENFGQDDSDPFYSQANMERLRESIAEIEKTGGEIHEIPPELLALADDSPLC